MANSKEKIALGWEVSPEVKDSFRDFCIENGFVVQNDCAGALTIWPYLPAAIRERSKLQANGVAAIDEKFWEQFRAGLELALQARSNIQQEKPDRKSRKK